MVITAISITLQGLRVIYNVMHSKLVGLKPGIGRQGRSGNVRQGVVQSCHVMSRSAIVGASEVAGYMDSPSSSARVGGSVPRGSEISTQTSPPRLEGRIWVESKHL